MSGFVEVEIDSVRASLMSPQRVVVLRQVGSNRYLTIWVGPYEAEAITVALQEIEMIRPLTHDLLKSVFAAFNAILRQVEIVSLREDIYYGNIVAEVNGRTIAIDSRPSDAIALAVRAHIPILVSKEVMDTAGFVPDQNLQAGESSPGPAASKPTSPIPSEPSEDRLSIFEDFLEKLEKEKDNDQEDDSAPDEPKQT
jgi:bifunctional DNase/RNase